MLRVARYLMVVMNSIKISQLVSIKPDRYHHLNGRKTMDYKIKQQKYKKRGFVCFSCRKPFAFKVSDNQVTRLKAKGSIHAAQCGECASKRGGLSEQGLLESRR